MQKPALATNRVKNVSNNEHYEQEVSGDSIIARFYIKKFLSSTANNYPVVHKVQLNGIWVKINRGQIFPERFV